MFTDTFKSKKGNVLLYGLVKVSAIRFRSHDDQVVSGLNFMFELLDWDRYIGCIVIPWIVKLEFCSIHSGADLGVIRVVQSNPLN